MLKWKDENGADCEVALDEDGACVMLKLVHGKARFYQALSATDVGRIIRMTGEHTGWWGHCCEGDLSVRGTDRFGVLRLGWNDEGVHHIVALDRNETVAFCEALKGYCRLLMRTPRRGMP